MQNIFFPDQYLSASNEKNLLKTFLLVLTLKIKFAGTFIIIFVISASKYVGIVSFKLIVDKSFSEVYPKYLTKGPNYICLGMFNPEFLLMLTTESKIKNFQYLKPFILQLKSFSLLQFESQKFNEISKFFITFFIVLFQN